MVQLIIYQNLLKKKKQVSRVDSIIMTEGYMDVIALHKAGFDTAVASMGTALTQRQASLLKNYAPRVYISYDGDGAGQKATLRGLDILAAAGLSVRVVRLPEGLDPDDLIKTQGAAAYQKLLDEAVTLTAFKIDTLKKSYDVTDPEGKSKFAVEAVKIIKELENPVEQEEYINLVQKYTGYSKQVLMRQAELVPEQQTPISTPYAEPPKSSVQSGEDRASLFVLASLAADKDYAGYENNADFLPSYGAYRTLYSAIEQDHREKGSVRTDSMFSRLTGEEKELLSRIVGYEFVDGDGAEKYKDCIRLLKTRRTEEQIEDLTEKSKTASPEETKRLTQEILLLTRRLKEIKTEKR